MGKGHGQFHETVGKQESRIQDTGWKVTLDHTLKMPAYHPLGYGWSSSEQRMVGGGLAGASSPFPSYRRALTVVGSQTYRSVAA